jgi:hypothetical protein
MKKKMLYLTAALFCTSMMASPNTNNKKTKEPTCSMKGTQLPESDQALPTKDDMTGIWPITHFFQSQI